MTTYSWTKKVNKKLDSKSLTVIFNKICQQENLLPKYSHTHTQYIYIYIEREREREMVAFVKSDKMIKISKKVDKSNTYKFSSNILLFIQGRNSYIMVKIWC